MRSQHEPLTFLIDVILREMCHFYTRMKNVRNSILIVFFFYVFVLFYFTLLYFIFYFDICSIHETAQLLEKTQTHTSIHFHLKLSNKQWHKQILHFEYGLNHFSQKNKHQQQQKIEMCRTNQLRFRSSALPC